MKRTVGLFVFALALVLGFAAVTGATTVYAEPTPGLQVHLPILNFIGNGDVAEEACEVLIEVQNVGNDFAKAAVLFWGEPGACPPQCNGPFKIECTGLLKPGSTWNFVGGAGQPGRPGFGMQIPGGAWKAIVFSLNAEQTDGDIFADAVCEALDNNVEQDCDEYRRFKKAFDEAGVWAGFDFDDKPGQPLAVEVVRKCLPDGAPADMSSAYSGLSGEMLGAQDPVFGGFAFYAPVVYSDFQGKTSYLYIQNAGLECTSVELWFKDTEACLRANISEVFALAPGETVMVPATSVAPGPNMVGSVWVRTTVRSGLVVDTVQNDEILYTYHGKPAELNFTFDPNSAFFTQGSQVNYGPLIFREHQGWDSSIWVQNLSSVVNAKVKVYFLDNSGDVITTMVDWICPRGSQLFFLPVINNLPGAWVGNVRVESQEWFTPGDPKVLPPNIVSIAELARYSDPSRTTALEGMAYNLFPEQQAFDWQLGPTAANAPIPGPGAVALIGIPSFLNNLGGQPPLTTELAIANLVPKPGFTDFAIYIYDQNGLLDFVCEKLNEKQVEYINVAQNWNYINDGFKGSAVISATFWEHPVIDPNRIINPVIRNLVGLAAVKVERFGELNIDPREPTLDPPGDDATASEGFPVLGAFDFEGPQAPACPGVGEGICRTNVTVRVTTDGTAAGDPVGGVVVQLRTAAGVAVATGVTDSNGFVVLTNVPVPTPLVTRYGIWVQAPGADTLEQVGNTGILFCPGTNNAGIVPSAPLEFNIAGSVCNDLNGNGVCDPTEPRFEGVTVVLVEADGDETEDTTDANGDFNFDDVAQAEGPFQLKAIVDGVSWPSPLFNLNADYDGTLVDAAGNAEQPNFSTDGDKDTAGEDWREPGGGNVNGSDPGVADDEFDIVGTVFADGNGNCVADVGETRFANVTIRLRDPGPDGAVGGGDDSTVATVQTNANGEFRFAAVARDDYFLRASLGAGNVNSPVFTLDGNYDGSVTDANGDPEYPNLTTPDGNTGAWWEPSCDAVDGPGGN